MKKKTLDYQVKQLQKNRKIDTAPLPQLHRFLEIPVDRYECTDEAYILAMVFLHKIHSDSQTEKTNEDTSIGGS